MRAGTKTPCAENAVSRHPRSPWSSALFHTVKPATAAKVRNPQRHDFVSSSELHVTYRETGMCEIWVSYEDDVLLWIRRLIAPGMQSSMERSYFAESVGVLGESCIAGDEVKLQNGVSSYVTGGVRECRETYVPLRWCTWWRWYRRDRRIWMREPSEPPQTGLWAPFPCRWSLAGDERTRRLSPQNCCSLQERWQIS